MVLRGLINMARTPARTFSSTMSPRLFTFFLLCALCSNVLGCNIDTDPQIFTPPTGFDYSDGLFGYSVLLHRGFTSGYVLVGAPKADSMHLAVDRPGTFFICDTTSTTDPCREVIYDETGNTEPVGTEYVHMKDNAWIGVSITKEHSRVVNDFNELPDFTVCGHRYANDYYMQFSTTPDINAPGPCDDYNITLVNDTLIDECPFTWPASDSKFDNQASTFDANDRFPNGICYTFDTLDPNVNDPFDTVATTATTIPCAKYDQTDESSNSTIHGWCQAGMSAQYTADEESILLGAAGSYNWKGTVFEGGRVDLDFQPAPDVWGEYNDYTGYAVSSGYFTSTDTIQGVTSAPRATRLQKDITTGKVIIYDLTTYQVYQELYGELMNTYYGAAIAAIDINNDTWTDLLVGAPLYTEEHDEGRVYVYINNGRGEVEAQDFKLSGNNAPGGRFGSAIASAEDLNSDGYRDVVIGAPWEDDNSGAVYVYFGTEFGIQRTYSQRLGGKDFVPGIKSFGLSVSGGEDIDSNYQPDVAIGAPLSERMFLFKTRPVANMRAWLQLDPNPIDIDIKNCQLEGVDTTCINVSVCFFYESRSTPKDYIRMNYDLTVDYYRLQDGFRERFYFVENGVRVTTVAGSEVQARFGENVCFPVVPYTLYVDEDAVDFVTPISFHLYYGIDPTPGNCRGDALCDEFFAGLPPIIDENICGNGTLIEELQFIQDCGSDVICQTDMRLSGKIIFPDGESEYVIGAHSTMHAELRVDNDGEEAHNAKLLIRHSREIVFEALEISETSCLSTEEDQCSINVVVTCLPVESQNNTAAVECALGNPMIPMSSSFFRMRFDVGAVTYERGKSLEFSAEVNTISIEENPSNNQYQPRIPIVVLADVIIRGQSAPPALLLETNKTTAALKYDDKLNVNLIGPTFTLLFEAPNLGPGWLQFDSSIYISIPWRSTNGDWLIYIKNIALRGVPGICNNQAILDLQKDRLDEHYLSTSRSPVPQAPFEGVYEGVSEVEESTGSQLTCNNAMCVTIQCDIAGPLFRDDSAVVLVEAVLWAPTFLEADLHLQYNEFVSQSVIKVNAPRGTFRQPEDDQAEYYNLATGVFTDNPPGKPVAWWIILVSVLGGLFLLILLIIILFKCGFFKREQKAEMKKMSMAAGKAGQQKNQAYDEDEEDGDANKYQDLEKADVAAASTYEGLKPPDEGGSNGDIMKPDSKEPNEAGEGESPEYQGWEQIDLDDSKGNGEVNKPDENGEV